MAIPNDVLNRLQKLLGLLGSDYENERAVAGRMASDLLREHKLTWADVIAAGPPAHLSGRQTLCLDRVLIKCRHFARASGAQFT